MSLTAIIDWITSSWSHAAMVIIGGFVIYALLQILAVVLFCPRDRVNNGIKVGKVKVFDSRSLQLRIERLSKGLSKIQILDQNITEGLRRVQERSALTETRSISIDLQTETKKNGGEPKKAKANDKANTQETVKPRIEPPAERLNEHTDPKASVGLAASDLLSGQLELASQIMNLETLYERSLTDRLIGSDPRLQSVLGLQISINPPSRYKNCVAIVEIGARIMPEKSDFEVKKNQIDHDGINEARKEDESAEGGEGISLIALIPNQKAYHAESQSTISQEAHLSLVKKAIRLLLGAKDESRRLVIHRDADTIAFERDDDPTHKDDFRADTIFGWEFRPVLGQSSVAAGMRQLLAVVAVPAKDSDKDFSLQLKAKTYWRRYNRSHGTTRPRWQFLPLPTDGSGMQESQIQTLTVFGTTKIEHALAPQIDGIVWTDFGNGRVSVTVKGKNFFSGTQILMNGETYDENTKTLILKSDQNLEFNTTIDALCGSDGILRGRFGQSIRLELPTKSRPAGITITKAEIKPKKSYDQRELEIAVVLHNGDNERPLRVEKLTDPLLYIGDELVPPPYRFLLGEGSTKGATVIFKGLSLVFTAWVSPAILARNSTTTFRLPFCGVDCKASMPFTLNEPTIVRLGEYDGVTTLHIAHPLPPASPYSVELGETYTPDDRTLMRINDKEFHLKVRTRIISRYQYLIVRSASHANVLQIPDDKAQSNVTFVSGIRPPRILSGSFTAVVWTGSGLDAISEVALRYDSATDSLKLGTAESIVVPLTFSTYDSGNQIEVYFSGVHAEKQGKAEVVFTTDRGDTFDRPVYVTVDDIEHGGSQTNDSVECTHENEHRHE